MGVPVRRAADVVTLPIRGAAARAGTATDGVARRARAWTTNEVDDWGRDDAFARRVHALGGLRWNVAVGGAEHVPERAGALVIVNARRFALTPAFAASAIGAEVGRPVRFVGRPDVAPLGPLLQRLGALLPLEAELEGALRAGELVVLGANPELTSRRTGAIDHRLVGAAVTARVRVLPAAAISLPGRRLARVEIGPPARLAHRRRGPLAELETADLVQARIDAVLAELGDAMIGTPLDRLTVGGQDGR